MQMFLDWTWGNIDAGDVGPGMFSWFHLLCLALMIVFTVAICVIFGRKHSAKMERWVVGIFALLLLAGELFKQQFWFAFYGYYRWEIFPFQFCSVPIYVSLFATVAPWAKAREVCYRFLAFFGIIGGLAVMLVPSAVLYTYFVADWILVLVFALLNAVAFILLLPLQSEARMDMFRIYKSGVQVKRQGDEEI